MTVMTEPTVVDDELVERLLMQFDDKLKELQSLHVNGGYVKLDAAMDVLLDSRQVIRELVPA